MLSDLSVLANFRDLGGLPVQPGSKRTRAGVLYRSSVPMDGDRKPERVAAWPARTVIDLRSVAESASGIHPYSQGQAVIHQVPLTLDGQCADADGRLGKMYRALLASSGTEFVTIFNAVNDGDGPAHIHCVGGKDRTGIAVAMLLRAAGVPSEDVVADYEATDQHMEAVMRRITAQVPDLHRLYAYDGDVMRAAPEAMHAVLDAWDAYPGGVHGWLMECGVAEDSIGRWIERFVDDGT